MSQVDIRNISVSSYLEKFKCLGSNCDFTCCGGWNIAVDKDSFDLVQKTINESTDKFQDLLTYNENFTRREFYGKLHLRNCMCPILDKDFLCSLQKQHGESALPMSCATFPVVNNYINGTLQKSARLSCPEIARLVLLCEDGFSLSEGNLKAIPYALQSRIEIANEIDNANNKNNLSHYFFEIQSFIIDIIKNRRLKIEERLSFIILFISNLTKISFPINPDHMRAIFLSIQTLINNKKNEKSSLKDTDFQQEFLIGNIISEHIKVIKNLNNPDKYPKIFNTLELSEKLDFQTFEIAIHGLYEKFSSQHSSLLENFLLNWILNELFPFKTDSLHYETVRLIINFSLIRFLIIANSLNKTSIEKNDAIDIIFLYTRIFGNTELPKLKTSFRTNRDDVFDLLYILNNI